MTPLADWRGSAWRITSPPQAKLLGDQSRLTREKSHAYQQHHRRGVTDGPAFAISCLILVMVGCALGMMFRSGNFLTAFAVSFIPALLSITLIIAGQRTAETFPATSMEPTIRFELGAL